MSFRKKIKELLFAIIPKAAESIFSLPSFRGRLEALFCAFMLTVAQSTFLRRHSEE